MFTFLKRNIFKKRTGEESEEYFCILYTFFMQFMLYGKRKISLSKKHGVLLFLRILPLYVISTQSPQGPHPLSPLENLTSCWNWILFFDYFQCSRCFLGRKARYSKCYSYESDISHLSPDSRSGYWSSWRSIGTRLKCHLIWRKAMNNPYHRTSSHLRTLSYRTFNTSALFLGTQTPTHNR